MVQSSTEQAASVSSQETTEVAAPKYTVAEVVACMRNSATMLALADNDRPNLQQLNRKQAELLFSAAASVEAFFRKD